MKKILFFLVLQPLLSPAQPKDNGVQFVADLTWNQILKKAKKEHKYIFVDCYTTWCGPCKLMEKEVYVMPGVGDYFNRRFLSVKMQMDRTKNDDELVRNRYPDADTLQKKYGVPVYPTYFFFSSQGQLINRGSGYKSDVDFVSFAAKSIDPLASHPYQRYYAMLAEYQRGIKDYALMPDLIDTAKLLNQDDVVVSARKDYISYLSGLSDEELYGKGNISFLGAYIQSSKSRFFHLFYPDGEKVNTLMQKNGYAQSVVGRIIFKEDIDSVLHPAAEERNGTILSSEVPEPDWNTLTSVISKKYTAALAEECVLKARVKWDEDHHQWADCAKSFTILNEKYAMDANDEEADMGCNATCWEAIFKRSVDKEQIDVAIKCMGGTVQRIIENGGYPTSFMDTYANLLYKAGKVDEAVLEEQKALKIAIEGKSKGEIRDYQDTIDKMKNGKPTWPRYIDKDDFFHMGLI